MAATAAEARLFQPVLAVFMCLQAEAAEGVSCLKTQCSGALCPSVSLFVACLMPIAFSALHKLLIDKMLKNQKCGSPRTAC